MRGRQQPPGWGRIGLQASPPGGAAAPWGCGGHICAVLPQASVPTAGFVGAMPSPPHPKALHPSMEMGIGHNPLPPACAHRPQLPPPLLAALAASAPYAQVPQGCPVVPWPWLCCPASGCWVARLAPCLHVGRGEERRPPRARVSLSLCAELLGLCWCSLGVAWGW